MNADGVPGVSQRPIPPGGTYVYKWRATQYGTYWYHGHLAGQLEDGLFGPIHITFVQQGLASTAQLTLIDLPKAPLHHLISSPITRTTCIS
jgi:hypothetical protein